MSLRLKAPAKINLGLSILGRLANGYHQVKTIYTQISLFDLIEIDELKGEKIEIECDMKEVLIDEKNLVFQAVEELRKAGRMRKGVRIKLEKKIPIGSGLGGGSADAAGVLRGLNKFWKLGLSIEEMMEMAKKLGADVGYQLVGGVKLEIQGGGQAGEFEDLGELPECFMVVGVPEIKISSQQAYARVDYSKTGKNDLGLLVKAIKSRNLKKIAESLHNDFEEFGLEDYPEVKEIKKLMMEEGALGSLMSGKGSGVFGVFESKRRAEAAVDKLRRICKNSYLVEPYYLKRS
jgi:4-diphosphocytidyl-2-C-methyl-D-erythritol kinase